MSRLLIFCRDCFHMEFNKEAWLLFYQVLENHPGSFEILKSTVLNQFLECVGPASVPVVMQNGLHCLAKVNR